MKKNSLYKWTLEKAAHKKASWFLGFISFIESSVFPVPPDIILIPMVLAKREKVISYISICTIGSVLGAILGYIIGAVLYESVGVFIIESYNLGNKFDIFKDYYIKYGVWLILLGGFTPFPYKLITIASGVFMLNFPLFILMSIISRGIRFTAVASLLWYFGPQVKQIIENHFGKYTFIFFFFLVLSYALIKFI